ncbi:MAG: TIGR03643 family protein [Bacteroidota bacterium]
MSIAEKYQLSEVDVDRIIAMAWEDRTPFEAIKVQFGLPEADVIKLMKQEMRLKNWQKWRARVQGRKTKHRKLRQNSVDRFRSGSQREITQNRISKKKY